MIYAGLAIYDAPCPMLCPSSESAAGSLKKLASTHRLELSLAQGAGPDKVVLDRCNPLVALQRPEKVLRRDVAVNRADDKIDEAAEEAVRRLARCQALEALQLPVQVEQRGPGAKVDDTNRRATQRCAAGCFGKTLLSAHEAVLFGDDHGGRRIEATGAHGHVSDASAARRLRYVTLQTGRYRCEDLAGCRIGSHVIVSSEELLLRRKGTGGWW